MVRGLAALSVFAAPAMTGEGTISSVTPGPMAAWFPCWAERKDPRCNTFATTFSLWRA
jgi:hypothetical protein